MGDRARGFVTVTGATGNVGREVVRSLLRQQRPVRTATPNPDDALALFGDAAEHVAFDYERPETFGPAVEGAEAVFLMRPPPVSAIGRTMSPFIKHLGRRGTCT
jgi:uncharacterized protein YbjT (DUF2867 family)